MQNQNYEIQKFNEFWNSVVVDGKNAARSKMQIIEIHKRENTLDSGTVCWWTGKCSEIKYTEIQKRENTMDAQYGGGREQCYDIQNVKYQNTELQKNENTMDAQYSGRREKCCEMKMQNTKI